MNQRSNGDLAALMDPGPEIDPHHHHHTGRPWLDLVLGVTAILISLISLILAILNGDAMQRLVAANSWPYVNVGNSNTDESGAPLLILTMQNKGVGPAKIQSLEVFYDGKAMAGSEALIHAMLGPAYNGLPVYHVASSIVGGVLSAKESVDFLQVKGKLVPRAILEQLAAKTDGLGYRVCYCSVFDECWMFDRSGAQSSPKPIKTCPRPATPYE